MQKIRKRSGALRMFAGISRVSCTAALLGLHGNCLSRRMTRPKVRRGTA